ncbi:MAG: hypothetical protein COU35_02070 [Candidatus Magasanikbacteria bacterium CG10_big_fil_rev_8_21_14_0_10_47_10]|uniref:Uncharacterized protein n=1 Tax=Candidatus Magasanikbacteria bacterium CG10_big_fil_rev_8_21_14_0_10_47_10 TaxID=1974652 RepID=A0A2H0TQW6_9BACT|nr:MAG: hypothetical protein COU35_02070 [Candidatus Magasanikbacteria bacterium CG10_big_fil_rev_8_21_14_0_10_47_10]
MNEHAPKISEPPQEKLTEAELELRRNIALACAGSHEVEYIPSKAELDDITASIQGIVFDPASARETMDRLTTKYPHYAPYFENKLEYIQTRLHAGKQPQAKAEGPRPDLKIVSDSI